MRRMITDNELKKLSDEIDRRIKSINDERPIEDLGGKVFNLRGWPTSDEGFGSDDVYTCKKISAQSLDYNYYSSINLNNFVLKTGDITIPVKCLPVSARMANKSNAELIGIISVAADADQFWVISFNLAPNTDELTVYSVKAYSIV